MFKDKSCHLELLEISDILVVKKNPSCCHIIIHKKIIRHCWLVQFYCTERNLIDPDQSSILKFPRKKGWINALVGSESFVLLFLLRCRDTDIISKEGWFSALLFQHYLWNTLTLMLHCIIHPIVTQYVGKINIPHLGVRCAWLHWAGHQFHHQSLKPSEGFKRGKGISLTHLPLWDSETQKVMHINRVYLSIVWVCEGWLKDNAVTVQDDNPKEATSWVL